MIRTISKWMLAAVPAAALFVGAAVAEAETKPRQAGQRSEREPYNDFYRGPARYSMGQRFDRQAYNDFYRGPPRYNLDRMSYRVPNANPVPPFGYYGSQQYYSLWVPSFYYSFR